MSDWKQAIGYKSRPGAYVPGTSIVFNILGRNVMARHNSRLSKENYETQLLIQGGVCWICRQPNSERYGKDPENLSVDHVTIRMRIGLFRAGVVTECSASRSTCNAER